jgi:hypothetical protein
VVMKTTFFIFFHFSRFCISKLAVKHQQICTENRKK